jgi:hypothetical protein
MTDAQLLTAYRSWKAMNSAAATATATASAAFNGDVERAEQLLREYNAKAKKRSRLKLSSPERAEKREIATLQQRKRRHEAATNSASRTVTATYSARTLDDWGHKQLRIVDSPASDPRGVLTKLKRFAEFLELHYDTWIKLFKWVSELPQEMPCCSVRIIDGGRLEFMLSGSKGWSAFILLIKCMNDTSSGEQESLDPESFRLDVIDYAHQQMRKDDRTAGLEILQDEGLIISTKAPCAAQNPHMDLMDPRNVQGGMLITGGEDVKATYEYEAEGVVVENLKTFLDLYSDGMPVGLLKILLSKSRDPNDAYASAARQVSALLLEFGRLLSESLVQLSDQPEVTENSPLRTGSLFTLPGNVIHAGPSTTHVRAILFLVATSKTTRKYDADLQYNRTNMWVTIAEYVWVPLEEDTYDMVAGREYLLRKIEECATKACKSSNTIAHYYFRKYAEAAEEYAEASTSTRKDVIRKVKLKERLVKLREDMAKKRLTKAQLDRQWQKT